MLITFSGLDGAGKSTAIEWLQQVLAREQRRCTVLHLNDHVGVYAWARAIRDRVVGGPPRNDDKPRMEPLDTRIGRLRDGILWSRGLRRLLYPVDLLIFLGYRAWIEKLRGHVLIMDRYFYDRLVDIADGTEGAWLRSFMRLTPEPDLAILLEISPEEAYARKGEYTVPYLARRARAYRRLFRRVPRAVRIPAREWERTRRRLHAAVRERLA